MDAWHAGVLLQEQAIFPGGVVPFSLRLEGLGVELMRLRGLGCCGG